MKMRTAHLPDGRSVEFDADNPENGGLIKEAFYLSSVFSDKELRLWIRNHSNIHFKSFETGAILIGTRLLDKEELDLCIRIAVGSQDQFFLQLLEMATSSNV